MSTTVSQGILWPLASTIAGGTPYAAGTSSTLNAANLQAAHMGRVYINGRPSGSKTLSAAGSGKLAFMTGSVTWNNGTSSIDFGIQGISTSAGPPIQPDGSFSVKKVCPQGSVTISSNAWNSITMGTGTVSLTHGDRVAVVWNMTARGGSDSVAVRNLGTPSQNLFPLVSTNNGSSWSAVQAAPNILLTFDDGTLGTIDGTAPYAATPNTEAFSSSSNPERRGILFTVPVNCYVDALWSFVQVADASASYTLELWSDPLNNAQLVTSIAVDPHQVRIAAISGFLLDMLATEVALIAGVPYGIVVSATGTSNVSISFATVNDSAHLALYPGGSVNNSQGSGWLQKITRHGGSGNFSLTSATITYPLGVRISSFAYANQLVNSGALVG